MLKKVQMCSRWGQNSRWTPQLGNRELSQTPIKSIPEIERVLLGFGPAWARSERLDWGAGCLRQALMLNLRETGCCSSMVGDASAKCDPMKHRSVAECTTFGPLLMESPLESRQSSRQQRTTLKQHRLVRQNFFERISDANIPPMKVAQCRRWRGIRPMSVKTKCAKESLEK